MTKMRLFKQSGNGQERSMYRIRCSKCGCADAVGAANRAGALPPEVLNKKFAQKGWFVGKDESRDECPGCQLRKLPERSLVVKFPGSDRSMPLAIVSGPLPTFDPRYSAYERFKPELSAMAKENTAVLRPDPPKSMGRDERRLVFEKLNEVYLDEKHGYSDGWSDARVATDMGVPRAWVSSVRDEMFGPERNEAEVKALLTECKAALEQARKVLSDTTDVKKKIDELTSKVDRIAS